MSDHSENNRPIHVLIDRAAFRHNLSVARKLCPDAKIMAVIKADGYGHGMEVTAQALKDADEFAVSSLDDVRRLREAGIDTPITVLSACLSATELDIFSQLNARPTLYDLAHTVVFEQISDDRNLSLWVKIDTGMGRLGLLPEDLPQTLCRLKKIKGIRDMSLMTHLANADDPAHPSNQRQLALFRQIIRQLSTAYSFNELSVLNSGGMMNFADSAESVVRPGIMLYGVSPIKGVSSMALGLKPVMTLKSKIISVRHLLAGSAIGYGSTYVLDQDCRIGVVACGYGDGYPRHAKCGTSVLVNGIIAPLIGRVSMDMISINLGEISAEIGDDVVLWGEHNPIEEVAESASTIAYELCCSVLPRVKRVVI